MNEIFIDACVNGDLNIVTKILGSIKDFNVEITDNMGKTALRLAIENEHLEVKQLVYSLKLILLLNAEYRLV